MTEPAAWGIVDIDGELTVTSPEREDIEASVQPSSGDTVVPLFMAPPKSVVLEPYEPGVYTNRGNIHDLEYYDGPLISAQMCRAKEDVPVIEVAIDNRAAETDGFTVYTRFSKEDLQTMLRMLEDPVVEQPTRCSGVYCSTCDPVPNEAEQFGFWVVVDNEKNLQRVSIHSTQASAEAWVGNQPDKAKVERGGYGIDGPCSDVDLVPMPDGTDEES